MADNYLEKRYEEVFGKDAGRKRAPQRPSLDTLLLHNRSYRGFDRDYVVHRRQLDAMIAVNKYIRMGRGLPHLQLPFPGREPEAFIVVCSIAAENPGIDIDLGISVQSMLLKAVEMGLGGLIIRNFDREPIREALSLPYEPICVIALGKPAEQIELVPVHEGDTLNYYRRDGIHYVPKLTAEDLTIK